ncbi:MAG: FeoB-associated Cys-rich membrane protein [Lachnospiraceae bacterium]|nr:FeoB-associated Cys-rich membrane protein [Lachnospiraceae bacterium]
MIIWLADNLGTIIVSIILIVAVAAALRSIIRNKKQGKTSCGGDCTHCMMQAGCKDAARLQSTSKERK